MGLSAFSFTLMAFAMTPRKAFVKTETGKHRDLKKRLGVPLFSFFIYTKLSHMNNKSSIRLLQA